MRNPTKRRVFGVANLLTKSLAVVLQHWFLILIAVFFLSDEGPHLRVASTYYGSAERPAYTSCTYLGSRGFREGYTVGCPLIIWMDTGEYDQ